jgi:hypothetical protein
MAMAPLAAASQGRDFSAASGFPLRWQFSCSSCFRVWDVCSSSPLFPLCLPCPSSCPALVRRCRGRVGGSAPRPLCAAHWWQPAWGGTRQQLGVSDGSVDGGAADVPLRMQLRETCVVVAHSLGRMTPLRFSRQTDAPEPNTTQTTAVRIACRRSLSNALAASLAPLWTQRAHLRWSIVTVAPRISRAQRRDTCRSWRLSEPCSCLRGSFKE